MLLEEQAKILKEEICKMERMQVSEKEGAIRENF